MSASYAKVVAFDHDGEVIRTFTGDGNHFQNFLDAVKSGRPEDLNASCDEGHISSALCHLGNISYVLGSERQLSDGAQPFGDDDADESFARFQHHLQENGLETSTRYNLGPALELDPAKEIIIGEHAERANALLTRQYREGFVVPGLG